MENLVYILKLFKKYNWFYFIKISLCKNIFRNLLGVGVCLLLILSMLAAFYGPLIYSLLLFISFGLLSIIIFKLIDKDHESTIKQPLTMEFLKHNYLILRIHAIKETLQKENRYNEHFLNKTIEECDTYLILEANNTSFILKHPLMIIPISIISTYFGALLLANKAISITNIIVILLTYTLFSVFPYLENKFAQVRTAKFILINIQNQMKQI